MELTRRYGAELALRSQYLDRQVSMLANDKIAIAPGNAIKKTPGTEIAVYLSVCLRLPRTTHSGDWIEESFHDPTGHNRHWTGFDERVENRWKHSGYPAGQMDSPIVCFDRNHLSCPDLFHRLCAVQLDLIVGRSSGYLVLCDEFADLWNKLRRNFHNSLIC